MEKKSTTIRTVLMLLLKGVLFIAIVAGTITTINYFTNEGTKNTIDDLLGIDPAATTKQEKEKEIAENAVWIAIPGFEKLVLQANSLTQEVSFENPEQNDVYFIISLSIDDAVVYESELIEPGKGMYAIELPSTYATGEYAGKLTYETRSMSDTAEKKNGAEINFPIIFE